MAYAQAPWPTLAQPSRAGELTIQSRAMSILTEPGVPGTFLPYEQAADVVAWHERHLVSQRKPASILSLFKRSTP